MIRTPIIAIRVGEEEITTERTRQILRVSLRQEEKKADSGEIVFRDTDHQIYDSRVFRKGAELVLVMGWTHEMEARGPFVVKSHKKDYPEDGESTFTVQFQDKSHQMNRTQRQRRFSGLTPDQILEQLANEYGYSLDAESIEGVTFTEDNPLIQANATDARLIQQLSERYGYVWGMDGNTIYFRRPVDLDVLGQQIEVKTLSYRINDHSLRSFSPEMKFLSGRRRRGSAQVTTNVNLLQGSSQNNNMFSIASTRDTVAQAGQRIAEAFGLDAGQDSDDDEESGDSTRTTDTQAATPNQRTERTTTRTVVDSVRQAFGQVIPNTQNESAGNVESQPGDSSGAATPDSDEEAERRNAGRVARASEVIEGNAVPTIASMRYRISQAVTLAGLSELHVGRYRITGITQSISDQTFSTTLSLKRQTFYPSRQSQQAIDEASTANETEADGMTSATGQPAITNQQESRTEVNAVSQQFGTTIVVDGQQR